MSIVPHSEPVLPVSAGSSGIAAEIKWSAKLTHNYRTINLGRFSTIEAAAAAVAEARRATFTHNDTDRISA